METSSSASLGRIAAIGTTSEGWVPILPSLEAVRMALEEMTDCLVMEPMATVYRRPGVMPREYRVSIDGAAAAYDTDSAAEAAEMIWAARGEDCPER